MTAPPRRCAPPIRPASFWTLLAAFVAMAALYWSAVAQPPPLPPAPTCDPIDFNNDGLFPDTADIDAFRDVMAGAACPACNDIDFNNDGLFPDQEDLQAFLRVFSGGPCVLPAGPVWRDYTPGPVDRQVYVSQSLGSDANPGTVDRPMRTTMKAFDGLRRVSGDGMFLRRGDVFQGWIGTSDGGGWSKSGLDAEHPLWCGAYGPADLPRPVVHGVGGFSAVNFQAGSGVRFVALDGIEFRARSGSPSKGLNWYAIGGDLLVQDCAFRGYLVNFNCESPDVPEGQGLSRLLVRGCLIADAFRNGAHSNGMHLNNVDGGLIEWTLFDNNGKDSRGEGDIFSHNVYLACNTTGVTFRHCTTARASATGVQLRAQDNRWEDGLSLDNPCGVQSGHKEIEGKVDNGTVYWPNKWDEWGCRGGITGTLIVGGGDIAPGVPRGQSGGIGYANGFTFARNIIIQVTGGDCYAIGVGGLQGAWTVEGNIVYAPAGVATGPNGKLIRENGPASATPRPAMGRNEFHQGVAPPVTFEDYLASIGCPTRAEYLTRARASWSRATWDDRYQAAAAIAFIRARLAATD